MSISKQVAGKLDALSSVLRAPARKVHSPPHRFLGQNFNSSFGLLRPQVAIVSGATATAAGTKQQNGQQVEVASKLALHRRR